MKLFLWMAGLMLFSVLVGVLHATEMGIPMTAENTPWGAIASVPLLLLAWWLSRPKPEDDEHKPVEKPE